ncbi:protein translocase subunit SecDF [Fulvivirgaceae bacterium PWU4]|uniref:Multifunctional fusion protein n=1 Tax=Chryseosolibacter histidini TaxID=2782349 RepID=A0AAP2GK55_9BACT|nr:protein translocase subunit SecDF [Chryseosolibacter histidini]MBT1698991.1 protein translocase subunit SecDF [Chryseosolibacter histidini]
MRNKGFVSVLTVVVTLLCLYYLSFTLISRGVQKDATEYATNSAGEVDPNKKQYYLDSVWNKPVFNFFGMKEYTYREIKDGEISLGLDLQGGMHVTLEVSPVDILRGLSGNNQDSAFVQALQKAYTKSRNSQQTFSSLFFDAYREDNPGKRLAPLFATASTRGRISLNATDSEVISIVEQEIESAIERSFTILRSRIDQFGTSQPNIQRLPNGRIQIEIPGAENPQRVRKLLQGVAKLEFWDVVEPTTLNASFMAINDLLVAEQKEKAKNNGTTAEPAKENLKDILSSDQPKQDSATSELEKSLANAADSTGLDTLQNLSVSPLFTLSSPPYSFRYDLKDTAEINRIFRREDVLNRLPRNIGVFWANKEDKYSTDVNEEPKLQLYFLDLGRNKKSKLTGEVIVNARKDFDERGRNAVSMSMNTTGTKVWAKWTADAATKGSRIAITLDNLVYSAPGVNEEIPFGSSIISGNFTDEEAKDLANILKAGSLPAPTKIVEEAVVGPTLGAESIQNGLISIVVGFLIIILFMVATYNSAGWVADAAVVLNLFFLLGILASLNAALTLPGIAGILLSLAIAVDANVLINERVKEDLNDGKPMNLAVGNGYKNAFSAIIDSNVTTLIKGFVLLTFGSGLIYGFAVTLIIGILCSLFTSVLFTRLIFEFFTKRGKSLSFSFSWSKNLFRSISIDFIGNRKIYYMVSGAVILAGMISLGIKGLNYGVDFKGGRTYIVRFEQPVSTIDLRNNLAASFEAAPEVKTYGFDNKYQITTSYLIENDSEEATNTAESKLNEGLAKFSGNKSEILSSSKVGPTVASDIRVSALYALMIAMGLMFLYILIRFRKWQFALGTMVSLVHTVLMVVALFSLLESIMPFSLEIDQSFVAAILTVIGYSINDSVVVFDRVREFLTGMKSGESTPTVINNALNDTLSRTLITGMSTIFVIIILFIFGGETIKGFTFAMLIGVLIGTYSSLCIGTPVLVDFSTRGSSKKLEPAKA